MVVQYHMAGIKLVDVKMAVVATVVWEILIGVTVIAVFAENVHTCFHLAACFLVCVILEDDVTICRWLLVRNDLVWAFKMRLHHSAKYCIGFQSLL